MRTRLGAALAAALMLAALGWSSASAAGATGTTSCSDGTVKWTPTKLWPPRHDMRDVTISYDEPSNDGDSLSILVTSISSDDDGKEKGAAADNEPDFAGVGRSDSSSDVAGVRPASVTIQLRAERMGTDRDGRIYTIGVQCSDAGNSSLTLPTSGNATLTVVVPHDRRQV